MQAMRAGWRAPKELRNESVNAIPENLPGGLAQRPLLEIAICNAEVGTRAGDFDALVDRVAELCGIRDQRLPLEETSPPSLHHTFDFAASWEPTFSALWKMMAELPLPQKNRALAEPAGRAG